MPHHDNWLQSFNHYQELQRQIREVREQQIAEQQQIAAQKAQELQLAREKERRLAEQRLVERRMIEQQAIGEGEPDTTLDKFAEQLRIAEQQRREARQKVQQKVKEQRATSSESPLEKDFYEVWCATYPSIRLERQYSIGRFRVDFAHVETKVVIELDGHQYHSSRKDRTRDAQRARFIQAQGWHLIRYTGTEIFADVDSCVMQVAEIITQRLVR